MPAHRAYNVQIPVNYASFNLTAMSHYGEGGYLIGIIGLVGKTMTIEYRMKDGYDAGIPGPRVLVYETQSGRITLVKALAPGTSAIVNGLSIQAHIRSGSTVYIQVQRPTASTLYTVPTHGDMMCQRHEGYLTGDEGFGTATRIGWGWAGYKHLFSTSGSIYGLLPDGRLIWHRHTDPDNCSASWAQGGTEVLSGLTDVKHIFGMPTAETPGGIIYVVRNDGRMFWYRHDGYLNGSRAWTGPVEVSGGFGYFTHVFPGAEGVVYVVDTGGDLYWCRHTGYKTGAKTWQNNGCNKIGWGWGGYSKLIGGSPDGVIYAISNDGVAYWHRHLGMLDGSQSWDPWGGQLREAVDEQPVRLPADVHTRSSARLNNTDSDRWEGAGGRPPTAFSEPHSPSPSPAFAASCVRSAACRTQLHTPNRSFAVRVLRCDASPRHRPSSGPGVSS